MKCITLIFSVIMLLSVNVLQAQITGSVGIYTTMEIGAETWLREDLRTIECPPINGELLDSCWLINAKTNEDWERYAKITPTYSWYNNNDETTETNLGNGLLYNWNAVKCNICPSGFRIPTNEELKELTAFQAKEKKDVGDGIRQADGRFVHRGSTQKTYWSSTEAADGRAKNGCAYTIQGISWSDPQDKAFGYYVRCIKMKTSVPKINDPIAADYSFGYGTSAGNDFKPFDAANNTTISADNKIQRLSNKKLPLEGEEYWWSIAQNITNNGTKDVHHITYPAQKEGAVVMHPGNGKDKRTKIRFTATSDGEYNTSVNWKRADQQEGKVLVEVWSNAGGSWKNLWTQNLQKPNEQATFTRKITLKKGDAIHFEVECAGDYNHDSILATFDIKK